MNTLASVWWTLWYLLGIPVDLGLRLIGTPVEPAFYNILKGAVGVFVLLFISSLLGWTRRKIRQMRGKDRLLEPDEARHLLAKEKGFTYTIEAARNLEVTTKKLRKSRDWKGLAQAHLAVGDQKMAAKFFRKAGEWKLAAQCLATAGATVQAARMLEKAGDSAAAARLYAEAGKSSLAARAYEQNNDLDFAADAYARSGKFPKAFDAYRRFFTANTADANRQTDAAKACLKHLRDPKAQKSLSDSLRQELSRALAIRFEGIRHFEDAARLYLEGGMPDKAGDLFVLAGKLEEGARCLEQAGRTREARQIIGRFYESRQAWADAARAYQAADAPEQAGDCYAKCKEYLKAAECFEQAGERFRAGLAYAHADRFEDTVRILQQMSESDPKFHESRALLGRAFYQLHDYARCAAALDNHLTGHRAEKSNMEFFYMLALAWEQLGKLDASRDILYKLHALKSDYRDVSARISNISSRIDMGRGNSGPGLTPDTMVAEPARMANVQGMIGGRYHLEKELGRGGMGVVYLARDKQLDRPVALKFLGKLVDDSEQHRQRFVREAQTAARINHPNIISIYDISASAGKAYIAMEYVEGSSLYRHIQSRGKLTPREAVNLVMQAASALAALHEAGITHRDVKPDNLLVGRGGLVKVTDFGLAKAEDNRMTRTGLVMGTPCYMAPEQVLGKESDPRTDVYALGLVLHECLTGKTVFLDGNVLERQVGEMPPKPGETTEGIPPELDAIVMRCVRKDPVERYASMPELLRELRALKLQ
jgi:predicted Ser/Thr protein kinase